MSDSTSRLPARPSLVQLRKRAKERLNALRVEKPQATLADAQYGLAREYGFESWPKLVHHVQAVRPSERLQRFEQLADDLLAGYGGDEPALRRLIGHFGSNHGPDQVRKRVRKQVDDARGDGLNTATDAATLAEVRRMVARQYDFESWAELRVANTPEREPDGDSARKPIPAPPFYRIDTQKNTIEPRPPLTSTDWDVIFAIMEERGITGIRTAAVTDDVMARLARLDFVTEVGLGGAQGLTDEGLLHLSEMPQLERLDLSGWHSPITDRGLQVLRHLPSLRRVSLEWAQRVTDAGAANLSSCEHLEDVDLMGTQTGDGALRTLGRKRQLRKLGTGRLVTDAGLLLLHDMPGFKTWRGERIEYDLMSFGAGSGGLLLDGTFTDRGLASLEGLDGLASLQLFWHSRNFTGEGLAALANIANLGYLGCQGELCDDAAMRSIATLPKLRMLMAQGTVASDDGFIALSHSTSLQYLWGRQCPNLTGRGFSALADLETLCGLGVSCEFVDDAALGSLPRFPSLRELMPMDVPDQGFRHVGACDGLEALWCMYCRDTGDEATEHIAGLRLKQYYAGSTQITDRSLELLGRMTSIEKLEFAQIAAISDSGIAALAKLPRLREISIFSAPRVTRKGIDAFAPSVRVDYQT